MIFGPAGSGSDALWFINESRRRGDRRGQHPLRNGITRLLNGEALENVAPAQENPGGGIGEDHFSWAKPLALGDSRFVQIDQARLGAGDQQTIVRERIAQRAQAIAIQLRADKLAIGENQSGRAVPRLALLRKRGQRTADVARKQGIFLKGRRNHGEHGFFGRQTFEEAKLESIIETRGITDVLFKKREPRAHSEARAEFGGFGTKPAAVRDDGIDLAVVRDVTERLREMPGRLRVRGIALVKNSKACCKRWIAQVFVKLGKLPGREQSLIHDGLRRKRADVTARGQERFRAFS